MIAYDCQTSLFRTAIRRSRRRISASNKLIALSRSAIDRSREALRASNVCFVPPSEVAGEDPRHDAYRSHAPYPSVETVRTFLSDIDGEALDAVVADFSAAYREAVATGDDETADIVRKALMILGRRIADGLGPKAAGVAIN